MSTAPFVRVGVVFAAEFLALAAHYNAETPGHAPPAILRASFP